MLGRRGRIRIQPTSSESAVLAEEVDGRWKSVRYEQSLRAETCDEGHQKDGRDILFCRSSLGAFGVGEVVYAYVLDFARPDRAAGKVVWLYDDIFDGGAFERDGFHLADGFVSVRVRGATTNDIDADGRPDLVLDVERARAAPSKTLDDKMRALCKSGATEGTSLLPPFERTKLEIVSAGGPHGPTAAAKKKLATWGKEAPENMRGLEGAAPPPLTR